MKQLVVGVLAFHGDVAEHVRAITQAAKNLRMPAHIVEVRTRDQVRRLHGLIIPGGESTTLHKLCVREGMWDEMKTVPNLFGTCAGAIMLAKTVRHKTPEQDSLKRIDIDIDRNAYGRQTDSFEKTISTVLGDVNAVFIRAPRIRSVGPNVRLLAENDGEVIACEERSAATYTLAACFHPELTTTLFHEHFLKNIADSM